MPVDIRPPLVDFSGLADIPDAFHEGRKQRHQRNILDARKSLAGENLTPEQMSQQLMALGDLQGAAQVAQLGRAQKPIALSPGQTLYDPSSGQSVFTAPQGAKAPATRTFYNQQGREVVGQWSPGTRSWEPVGGARAQGGSALETIRRKIASGEPLSQGEQRVYDDALRGDPLMRALFGNQDDPTSAPAAPQAQPPAAPLAPAVPSTPGAPAVNGQQDRSPSQQSIDYLRQHRNDPETQRQFDEMFGAGSAARVLSEG